MSEKLSSTLHSATGSSSATDKLSDPSSYSFSYTTLTILIVISFLAGVGGLLFVTGAYKDVVEYVGERYFKAKAKAEEKALEHAGETEAEGFLKDQLKKNPVVSNDELNAVSGGLGDEAAKEFGGESLGKVFGK
ncbi:hypothetical protein MMC25_005526 [Agyrium rufum]|nr:hypothetical protein [Agyrium rufum]